MLLNFVSNSAILVSFLNWLANLLSSASIDLTGSKVMLWLLLNLSDLEVKVHSKIHSGLLVQQLGSPFFHPHFE